MLTSVTAKRRKSWLIAASALGSASLAISEPALAANECGALGAGGVPDSATCTFAGNPYPNGINYSTSNTPIFVALDPGPPPVNVVIPIGSPIANAVNLSNATGGFQPEADATLTVNNAFIDNTLTFSAPNKSGLRIQASGNATITATDTEVHVTGAQSTNAIWAIVLQSSNPNLAATVNYNGPGVTSIGTTFSTVIQAENDGAGPAIIKAAGNMTGVALGQAANGITGLFAAGGSNGTVNYSSGTIDVRGNFANGIFAAGDSAFVTTGPGTTINVLSLTGERLKPGIALDSFGTAGTNELTATVASTIQMLGPAAPDPGLRNNGYGIRAFSFQDAPITVTLTEKGSITTFGGNGMGIVALSGGGSINVTSSGPITTHGSGAVGIFADSTNLIARAPSEFRATPVFNAAPTGTVQVNATNVTTTGQFSTGIVANGARDVMVNIAPGGSVSGGWQTGLTGGSDLFGLPAAGVILNSTGGVATLINDGSIGALSDRAVAGDPQVINNGTITGFVQFTGGGNSILNNGTFDLRHFADTDGDGVRDTVRVARADLGEGPNNSFTNNGTLRLPAVTGATALDSTGQYLPLGNPNNAMTPGGPLQGHLVGVATFTNSGTIDLQSNPVAGDVLAITGARQVGPAPTFPIAGVPGPGTFISNGGTLRLDTVLNEGGAATHSDTLVVDGTSVGAGGATSMAIRNAGGAGALTVGNGILVVEVLNPALSASRAFSLQGGSITEGAFDYFLFKGGASPGSQGNWYLRNEVIAPPIQPPTTPPIPPPEAAPGTPPLPTPVPGAPPIPLFQPGVAVMSVVPSVARTLGLLTLATFNERQGDQLLVRDGTKIGAWGRVFGQNTREHFAQGARPDFDGTFAGFQAGADLWRLESINGHHDNIGFYVAQARASGSVHGSVDGFEGALAGHVDLDASSYGGYWTHLGPSNWYIDTVVQGTHFIGTPNSIRGISTTAKGDAFAGSIEAGYPITLAPWLTFEPQIQGIWQRVWLNDAVVPVATISFDRADVFTGRAGALLRGTFGSTGAVWQPYLKGNVWWGSNGFDTVSFNSFGIPTGRNGGTTLEGGGGVTGKLTRYVSVYGDASYLTAVSGESLIALKGNVGLRVTW